MNKKNNGYFAFQGQFNVKFVKYDPLKFILSNRIKL